MWRGFYHDARFPTLLDAINHYDGFRYLNLTEQEKKDLVEYLKIALERDFRKVALNRRTAVANRAAASWEVKS